MRILRIVLLVGVLLFGGIFPSASQAERPVGEITGLTGVAVALRADGPVALRLGAPVFRTDRIRTQEGAKLRITFQDGSQLIAGADSTLVLQRFLPADRGLVELLRGIVRVVLDRAGEWKAFDVRTHTVVASARSTEWIVALSDDGTAIFVASGEVAVDSAGAQVLLGPGEGTDVPADGPPRQPVAWGDNRVRDVMARTTIP